MVYKLTNIAVIDGDSIRATIHLGFGVALNKCAIRIKGIDTPESRTKNKLEKHASKLVTKWLRQQVKNGQVYQLRTQDKRDLDKYGRAMGYFIIDNRNMNIPIIGKGLAKEYHGKKKEAWTDVQLNTIINQLTKEQEK